MPFSPKTWFDRPNQAVKVQAKDLNRIEQGIADVAGADVVYVNAAQTLTSKTLLSPKVDKLFDTLGGQAFTIMPVAGAVDFFQVSAGTGSVFLQPAGSTANVDINIMSKGVGSVKLRSATNGIAFQASPVASGVNSLFAQSSVTTQPVRLGAQGTDTNIGMNLTTVGTGVVAVNGTQVETKGHTHTVAQVTGARSWAAVPASAVAPGTAGQEAYDADFHYVCVAANTWKRTPLTTW